MDKNKRIIKHNYDLVEVHYKLMELFKPIEKVTVLSLQNLKDSNVPLKAYCYSRVSSEEQRKYGASAEAQDAANKEFCAQNNIEIYNSGKDEGFNATHANKPVWLDILSSAQENKINLIVVQWLSRLGRDPVYDDPIERYLTLYGVAIYSIHEPENDPFIRGIHRSLNKQEKRILIQRVEDTQKRLVAKGNWMNRLPFGYEVKKKFNSEGKKINAWIVVNKKHKEIVLDIFKSFIDNELRSSLATRHSKSIQTVTNILKNKSYIGILTYKGEEYKGKIPAIIPEDLFYKSEKLLL